MPDRKHHSEKFKRCVEDVMAKGNEEDSAYAICTTSFQKSGSAIYENAEMYGLHLCAATGEVRTEMVNGREHLVVPVVALMEGVIHPVNADTPEFVPWKTIERMAASFNGKPVVLNHPVKDGKQCSAALPGIDVSHGIGVIRNARAVTETKRLLMEALIDKLKAKQLHPEMAQRLMEGKVEEVSVGAFVVTDETGGEHNGRVFKAQWLAGSGDHLAFLPGKRGACSVAMGCGAHRAAESHAVAHLVTAEGIEPITEEMEIDALIHDAEESLRALKARLRGKKERYDDCPTCDGSGNKDGNPCPTCDGKGEVRHAEHECQCHKERTLGDKPGHPFYGNQHTGGGGGGGSPQLHDKVTYKGESYQVSGIEGGTGKLALSPLDKEGRTDNSRKMITVRPEDVGGESSDADRDDLKSSFSASLKEAHGMSKQEMSKEPARTAMVIIEGALEDPATAEALFDKASDAFNEMPEKTPRQEKAKTNAIRDFRFALARERQRAEFAAPKRWAKVVKSISTPKTLEQFEKDAILSRIKFEGGHWALFGSDGALRLGRYSTQGEAEEHAWEIRKHL